MKKSDEDLWFFVIYAGMMRGKIEMYVEQDTR